MPNDARQLIPGLVNENLKYKLENKGKTPNDDKNIADIIGFIKPSQINENYQNCSQSESSNIFVNQMKSLKEFVVNEMGVEKELFLKDEQFLKSINLMDLVSINSTRTSCFTKK